MSLELILIVVLGLAVLAEAALIWMLWHRPTPADSSQEVAALKARLAALPTPDLGPLHQMVNRLESELAELKATTWRGHPARAEADSSTPAESPDAGKLPAVQGDSPLLCPEDSASAVLGGGGKGLGERSSGGLPIVATGGRGGGADYQSAEDPDAGRLPAVRGDAGGTPAVRMTLDGPMGKTQELLNNTQNPTDRAYLTGLLDRLTNVTQVMSREDWSSERALIFGLYQPISDVGTHELSEALRPEVHEIGFVLDEARAEAIDHLRSNFGLEVIAPVTGTPFDPTLHEDSPTTRLTPPSEALSHTIYARIGLGLTQSGHVVEKAWVKRYAGYEGLTVPTPEPEPITEEAADNAARALLQQAAEHGN